MANEHHQRLLEAEKNAHEKVEAMRRESKAKEDRWANDLEQLRQEKDSRLRQLDREREEQRAAYELRINDLDSKLRSKSWIRAVVYLLYQIWCSNALILIIG
jgi:Growth-Arrest-Specific Protein 2 Domain